MQADIHSDEQNSRKLKKRSTANQIEMMVAYIEDHPSMIFGSCSSGAHDLLQKLWEDLTLKLNAIGPPTRNSKEWRKVWTDHKMETKKKLRTEILEIKNIVNRTPQKSSLNPIQERIKFLLKFKSCDQGRYIIRPYVKMENLTRNGIQEEIKDLDKEDTVSEYSLSPSSSLEQIQMPSPPTEYIEDDPFENVPISQDPQDPQDDSDGSDIIDQKPKTLENVSDDDCDDLHFFKSLIPIMKKFPVDKKLRIRIRMQQILLEEFQAL